MSCFSYTRSASGYLQHYLQSFMYGYLQHYDNKCLVLSRYTNAVFQLTFFQVSRRFTQNLFMCKCTKF